MVPMHKNVGTNSCDLCSTKQE